MYFLLPSSMNCFLSCLRAAPLCAEVLLPCILRMLLQPFPLLPHQLSPLCSTGPFSYAAAFLILSFDPTSSHYCPFLCPQVSGLAVFTSCLESLQSALSPAL